jgi:hypothetical protein
MLEYKIGIQKCLKKQKQGRTITICAKKANNKNWKDGLTRWIRVSESRSGRSAYRNAAIATDPLSHVCEVMLEPTLPLGKHLPATLVPVQRVEISNLAWQCV